MEQNTFASADDSSKYQIKTRILMAFFDTWVFPKNNGTPKSSILIGFSDINHPFWGTPIFGNTHFTFIPGKA